jgi:hypothetical protein
MMPVFSPTRLWFIAVALGASWVAPGWAQSALVAEVRETPIDTETGFLQSRGAHPRFEAASKIPDDAAVALQQRHISTVPFFTNSFAYEGRVFPFTLVGAAPQTGGTTEIPTQIMAVAMFFEGFADENGDPIVMASDPILARVLASPNFRAAPYLTGVTQFADAVQRAQFYKIMAQDWHTLLGAPEVLKPVVIDVPRGMAKVYRNRATGVLYAVVDSAFFISQLNTIVQLQDFHADSLAIILTANVFLAPETDTKRCCILGFHTSFESGQINGVPQVQTFVWASWIDQGLLGTSVADVTPLSHEISEWMNNPFERNQVPPWHSPAAPGGCQTNLETADPLAALPNAGYPVTIGDFTYHPQTQVLLPWFTRGLSDSLDGAFSFPDETLAVRPSQPCTNSHS